jgi:methylmalonyl-CoA mutase N-terminal domain/subunit
VNNQIKKLKKIKKNRDSASAAKSLEELKTAAESNSNLMPFIISAAKNECTLGEISDILRECFGEYKMS